MSEKLEKLEMAELLKLPAFLKFLHRCAIQTGGLFGERKPTADGTNSRNLFDEGRRSLGLETLRDAARGIPVDDHEAAFSLLLIQVLREATQSTQQEQPSGRRSRHDELRDDDGAGSGTDAG